MNFNKTRLTLPLICLCGVLAISSMVLATDDLFQFWVARFNSPENLDDIAWDLEVDDVGNIYLTGTCDRGGWLDVAILKYDSERNLLWQRYLDLDVLPLTVSFIELDGEGNVYVSCTVYDSGNPSLLHLVTRKYNSLGIEMWEASYDPDIQGEISDLEVDDDGNAYVSRKWGGIIKYDTNGNQMWWKYFALEILDIELDNVGNVCVTGSTSGVDRNIYTSKLDPEGTQIWYDYMNAITGMDGGLAVSVDGEGNVYVAGMSMLEDDVIKYKANAEPPPLGEREWSARFAITSGDWANSIAVDEDGNVYVSGSSKINSFYDCLTVKYDSKGKKLWEARYDGLANNEDLSVGLVLDSDANVYVSCQSKGGDPPQHDYATIMYDTDGNQLWVKRYDGSAHGEDRPQDIEIDGDGNVYVTGNSLTNTGFDFITIKYVELTASNSVTSLIFTVEDMELEHGIENSLVSKLNNVLKLVSRGIEKAAINQLRGFRNQVEGIRGIKLTNEQTDGLIEVAQEVINIIQS